MAEVIPVGASVRIDVIDAVDLRSGMKLLDSTYLACGVVSEIRRIYKDGGRGGHYEYRLGGVGISSCPQASSPSAVQ